MRIEKIDAIRQDMAFPQKEEAMSVLDEAVIDDNEKQKDTIQIDMSFYIKKAKQCKVDKEALEILLRVDFGDDIDTIRDSVS